jgi:predicted MFS family arabinose efflux permease
MNVNPAQHQGEFRRGWPIVLSAMLGIALGLSPVPFYTIGIFAPALAREFHWTYAQIMAGITFTTLAVLIASPLVGMLSDRFGVRRVALTSVVLFALSFMMFSISNGSLVLYYATWTVAALLGAGTLPITWTRAVNNAFNERKGLALGLSLIGTGLFGYAVKPFTAWLVAEFGWRTAYVVIGSLPLLISLPVGLLAFRDPSDSKNADGAQRRIANQQMLAATPGLTMRETLREWRFWLVGLCFVSLAFAVGGLIPNMENMLRIAGFQVADIVRLTSLIGLSVIVGRVAGGWLIDRFWAPGVSVFLLGAPAIACLLLAQGGLSYHAAMLAICLIGIAAGAEYDLLAFLVARYFGMKSYGAIYGALYSFFALGAGLGPVFFGATFDRTASYTSILYISSGLFLTPAILMLLLGRYRVFAAS